MEYLPMPRGDFKNSKPGVDEVTVGAAIIRLDASRPKILLLKRNASERHFPNVLEMAGGKVDATDPSIRNALVREVAEETQLTVVDVVAPLASITYTTEKPEKDASGQDRVVERRAFQLSYVVTVEGGGTNFKVNEDEHSVGIWADRESIEEIEITDKMKGLVLEALCWAEKQLAA